MFTQEQLLSLHHFANCSDALFNLGVFRSDTFVGDIGEFYASNFLNLRLQNKSNAEFDALDQRNNRVQIKTTQLSSGRIPRSKKTINSNYDVLCNVFIDRNFVLKKIICAEVVGGLEKIYDFDNYDIDTKIMSAIDVFAKAFINLKDLNIIRGSNIVGDIGEYIACVKLGLKQLPRNNNGADAVDASGTLYEIKTRRVYESDRRTSEARRIKNLERTKSTYVVVVTLDRNFLCSGMWKLLASAIRNPKSAHLGIVKQTLRTEIIVPTTIEWLK